MEIQPGASQVVHCNDEEVAVFNVDGELMAVSNRCPHRNGPLSRGHLEGATIRCPLHGWLYDLKTGQCLNQPTAKIKLFSAKIKRGQIEVKPRRVPFKIS